MVKFIHILKYTQCRKYKVSLFATRGISNIVAVECWIVKTIWDFILCSSIILRLKMANKMCTLLLFAKKNRAREWVIFLIHINIFRIHTARWRYSFLGNSISPFFVLSLSLGCYKGNQKCLMILVCTCVIYDKGIELNWGSHLNS